MLTFFSLHPLRYGPLLCGATGLVACLSHGSASSNNCNGPTSFLVFQSESPSSEIPVCNDSDDASPPNFSAPFPISIDGGVSGFPFAGAPRMSVAALNQCAAICSQATYSVPCCQSQWEPQTIVCAPACR